MLQVARLSPSVLGESSELIEQFLRSQQNPDGGFSDRGGASDLYYTVFGLEGLIALQAELPLDSTLAYLRAFGDGDGLDFVHLACLARCWAAMEHSVRREAPADDILCRIEAFRATDGGYHPEPGSEQGTIYGCFLAVGAYQDLGVELPNLNGLIHCIQSQRATDGGYANQPDQPIGLTPPTAAVATLLRHFGRPVDPLVAPWLTARFHPEGGFVAAPMVPVPDLLSTATALHALAGLKADVAPLAEPCLDFIDTLWTSRGGFHGSWEDDTLDSEYTYYGLLALGHLTLYA